MNLGTISLIVSTAGGVLAILAIFWKAIRRNGARARAQQGRISSLVDIVEIQSERIKKIEVYLSLPEKGKGKFQPSESLLNLEAKAVSEYQEHHTNLT